MSVTLNKNYINQLIDWSVRGLKANGNLQLDFKVGFNSNIKNSSRKFGDLTLKTVKSVRFQCFCSLFDVIKFHRWNKWNRWSTCSAHLTDRKWHSSCCRSADHQCPGVPWSPSSSSHDSLSKHKIKLKGTVQYLLNHLVLFCQWETVKLA